MGRKKDISAVNIGKIVTLKEEGYTFRQISQQLQVSIGSVHNVIRSNGDFISRRKNSGRKRITSWRDDIIIKRAVQRSPTASSLKIVRMLNDSGVEVSSRTVRRRLTSQLGLPARRPAKVPMLTKIQIKKRLDFCKQHAHWTKDDWRCVMFTDESCMQQVRNIGYNYVRRPKGSRLKPQYTQKTVKHPPTVMIWGAITYRGHAGLHFMEKNEKLNGQKYVQILNEKVKIHMDITGTSIFQQDSAPPHICKLAKQWFQENNVTLLDWPSNSPDLNCIENCWALMKSRVSAYQPKSMEQLKEIVKKVWIEDVTQDYCSALIDSMPERIKLVIKNKVCQQNTSKLYNEKSFLTY